MNFRKIFIIVFFFFCPFAVQPHIIQVSNDTVVIQPESVELECSSTGIPLPYISWYSEDMVLLTDNVNLNITENITSNDTVLSKLTILVSDPFDAQVYSCNSSNVAGYDVAMVNVTVHGKLL